MVLLEVVQQLLEAVQQGLAGQEVVASVGLREPAICYECVGAQVEVYERHRQHP